ncbi:ABC-three component system protein [Geobacter sp.]|uniref:ABC-three component system protein n=1 Tax=Geobacter sp. TaxID=46610 RepID=UPI00263A0A31|nr:ABC-three component system protein [Geobacter sp.]
MIHRIYSTLPTFKTLEFHPGLNVLMAQKETGASEKQTRNRAGKTSLIEIVHFLTGADSGKDSLFRMNELVNETFGMEFDLGGEMLSVERCGREKSRIHVAGGSFLKGKSKLSNSEWVELLGEAMFGLNAIPDGPGRTPTFRSLFAYFVRRQLSGAFTTPEKQANMQQAGDYQVALLFLLGLDWKITSDWQQVRDREKTLAELKKAAGAGAFGSIIGKTADLRTQLTVAEARLNEFRAQIKGFRVLPQYRELEEEADKITRQLNAISNDNTIDAATIRDLEAAMYAETPPPLEALEAVYAEAGVALPGVAIKRYDEVRSFHESVVRNRRDYLSEELLAARQRVTSREQEKQRLDHRRAEIMGILQSHGALDQFAKLQGEVGRLEAEVESLRQRFEAAEQLEGTKNELEIERNRLTLRLRRDFSEQNQRLSEAILAFEETSRRLYESAGSMTVEETPNGPVFQFPMQGSRSKGIKNMQIFCFDLMLMRLCAKRGIGPGFLIHDSHLFDGVDGRQVISALKVGAEMARELGFQYIVTMNEDDAFKEKTDGFDLRDYVLPVVLTDAREDGGLFGFRF